MWNFQHLNQCDHSKGSIMHTLMKMKTSASERDTGYQVPSWYIEPSTTNQNK